MSDQHGPGAGPPSTYRVFVPFWERAHLEQAIAQYAERDVRPPVSIEGYVDDPVRGGYITPHACEARYYRSWLQHILRSQLPFPNAFLYEVVVPIEPEPGEVPQVEPLLPASPLASPFTPAALDAILQAEGHLPSRKLPGGGRSTGYHLYQDHDERRFTALRLHLAIAGSDYRADLARLPDLAGYHAALARAGFALIFRCKPTPFAGEGESVLLVGDAASIDTIEGLRHYLATLRRYTRLSSPEHIAYATAQHEIEKWQAGQPPLAALFPALERHRVRALDLARGREGRSAAAFWERNAAAFERLLACLPQ